MTDKYSFSKHAKERMDSRGISSSMVKDVVKNPGAVIEESDCMRIYQKVLIEHQRKRLLRVFINICKDPKLIITAYKTSKIDKYEY
jgi:hypothetical protein